MLLPQVVIAAGPLGRLSFCWTAITRYRHSHETYRPPSSPTHPPPPQLNTDPSSSSLHHHLACSQYFTVQLNYKRIMCDLLIRSASLLGTDMLIATTPIAVTLREIMAPVAVYLFTRDPLIYM
jgi:hypothetical protein